MKKDKIEEFGLSSLFSDMFTNVIERKDDEITVEIQGAVITGKTNNIIEFILAFSDKSKAGGN